MVRRRLALARALLRGDPADASGRGILVAVTGLGALGAVLSNLAGAAVVFVLLAFVLPVPEEISRSSLLLRNLIAASIYLVFALVVGAATGLRKTVQSLTWLRDEREPVEEEREEAIGLALSVSMRQSRYWLLAVVLFTAINWPVSVVLAVEVGITMLAGTAVMGSATYLTYQRIARPVVARALEDEPPGRRRLPGVALRTFLVWGLGTGLPVGGVALTVGAGLALGADPRQLVIAALVLSLLALVTGLITILMFGKSIADPLRQMRDAMRQMETGDFDVAVPVYDASELGFLQASLNRMAARLRERERLRDLFGRHVGSDVADRAIEAESVTLGGEEREAGVLFVDVVGSTPFTESHEPTEVVDTLNRFFGIVVDVVREHGGQVNKFEGDAALCVWGAPLEHPDPAGAALAAARDLAMRLVEAETLPAAIGVAAGRVVAGNIGAHDRLEYTVIGDQVNEAARLTELAKDRPGGVLATRAAVRAAAGDEAQHWVPAGERVLRGRTEPLEVSTPRG